MDTIFTQAVQQWLDTPADARDYAQGAMYLLQLTKNTIMYRNLMLNPSKNGEFIEMQIKKYMAFRLAQVTHDEVVQMDNKVKSIANTYNLANDNNPARDFKKGKREDHDTLPADIQALFVENANIMNKMRELHLQLRNLQNTNTSCPDSDRYPFLKELIALDKLYHYNWRVYDTWSPANAAAIAEEKLVLDAREQQKAIQRTLNLTKGRYKKAPTEALKKQLQDLYAQLTAPTDTLTAELLDMGVITEA